MTAQRIVGDLRRALGYLSEALRLVRRHPALLVLPLLVAVFNVGEGYAGREAVFRYTKYGLAVAESRGGQEYPPSLPGGKLTVLRYDMVGPPNGVYVSLAGTVAFLGAAIGESTKGVVFSDEGLPRPAGVLLGLAFLGLLLLPVNGLFLGGYFGLLAAAVRGSPLQGKDFVTGARRFFARFWLLQAITSVLILLPGTLLFLTGGLHLIDLFRYWLLWALVTAVLTLPFVLLMPAPFALVWHDTNTVGAIKRGARVFLRDAMIPLTAFVAMVGVPALLGMGFISLMSPGPPISSHGPSWVALGLEGANECLRAALAALFTAALMLWYRDAAARLVPVPEPVPVAATSETEAASPEGG